MSLHGTTLSFTSVLSMQRLLRVLKDKPRENAPDVAGRMKTQDGARCSCYFFWQNRRRRTCLAYRGSTISHVSMIKMLRLPLNFTFQHAGPTGASGFASLLLGVLFAMSAGLVALRGIILSSRCSEWIRSTCKLRTGTTLGHRFGDTMRRR